MRPRGVLPGGRRSHSELNLPRSDLAGDGVFVGFGLWLRRRWWRRCGRRDDGLVVFELRSSGQHHGCSFIASHPLFLTLSTTSLTTLLIALFSAARHPRSFPSLDTKRAQAPHGGSAERREGFVRAATGRGATAVAPRVRLLRHVSGGRPAGGGQVGAWRPPVGRRGCPLERRDGLRR